MLAVAGRINILDDANWTWQINKDWILKASKRGDIIRVISDPFNKANI